MSVAHPSATLGGRRINLVVKSTISREAVISQIEQCFARNLPKLHELPNLGKADGPVALIAGGPSLCGELDNLRSFPGPLIACGSVHDYLIEQGVIPNYAVFLDPDRVMADFVKRPHPDTCYLLASHCHPAMFDALADKHVVVWHATIATEDGTRLADLHGEPEVGGGDGAILRAWPIAAIMGHRDVHFYGFDLSFPLNCESQHAYDYDLLKEEPVGVTVERTGERFITSPGWVNQLQEFGKMLALTRGQFEITIHGESLVASTFCKGLTAGAPEKFGQSMLDLIEGKYREGFAGYEYRQGLRGGKGIPLPGGKEWQGESLVGKTLLLHAEQGYGDMIMVMRYLPILIECGAKVLAVIYPELRPIFERIPGVRVIEKEPASWPGYDYWLGMMSLPHRFDTTLETIPPLVSIPLDGGEVQRFRQIIGGDGFKVGLCWASGKDGVLSEHKSIPPDALDRLFGVPGTKFFSLQVPSVGGGSLMADLAPQINSFLDTAHAIANLDLVITTDTAVAHVAGTLGVPTWVILSNKLVHWPWLREREDSPWYPSVRVFRQRADEEDWGGIIGRVRERLAVAVTSGIAAANCVKKQILGFDMELDLGCHHNRTLAKIIDAGGCYEPEMVYLLCRAIRPGDLFVDVGANAGFFTLLAARLGADVIAVEPAPESAARLRSNVRLNGFDDRVKIVEAAAWHEAGKLDLHIRADDSGGNALWMDGEQRSIEVPAVRLSAFIGGRSVRLVKVDAEGAEQRVLDGLGSCKPTYITCEIYNRALANLGSSQASLRSMMGSRGYETFELDYDGEMPKPVSPDAVIETPNIINILFSTAAAVNEAWRDESNLDAAQ